MNRGKAPVRHTPTASAEVSEDDYDSAGSSGGNASHSPRYMGATGAIRR